MTRRRTAPARRVRVSGRAELRPAMRAARTVMGLKALGTHAEPTCRLVAREAHRNVEVLATNGEVALRTYIDSGPQGTSGRLDVAIDKALVRELAETKAEMIAIRASARRAQAQRRRRAPATPRRSRQGDRHRNARPNPQDERSGSDGARHRPPERAAGTAGDAARAGAGMPAAHRARRPRRVGNDVRGDRPGL